MRLLNIIVEKIKNESVDETERISEKNDDNGGGR